MANETSTATRAPERAGAIDRFFKITERGSTIGTEVRGGLVTFFAMCYIVILNPIILSGADVDGNSLPFPAVAAVTALIAGLMTILMGVVGRYPFAVATGLGINAIVAVYAATQLSWPEIMGLIVLEGLLITLLVLTGFSLFGRRTWAGVTALCLVLLSAFMNFFFIPYYPLWSILVIALDVIVIYHLCTRWDPER